MDDSNFLKSGGGFLIAFLFGSATLHGMLYYLVTDANDLFSGKSLTPLFLFILLYALVPLMILLVWRRWILNVEIFSKFNTENGAFARVKTIEKSIAILLFIGLIGFVTYMVLWLYSGIKLDWLFFLSNVIQISGFVIIGIGIISLLLVKPKETDVDEKNENDLKADELSRKFNIEFKIVLLGWILLAAFSLKQFNNHVDVGNLFLNSTELSEEKYQSEIPAEMNLLKETLSTCDDIQESLNNIQHTVIFNSGQNSFTDSTLTFLIKGAENNINDFVNNVGSAEILNKDLKTLNIVLNSNNLTEDNIEKLRYWLAIQQNKILLRKKQSEEKLINQLKPILIKAQTYFLVLFTILLFAGVVYWYTITMAHVETLRLTNPDPNGNLKEVPEFAEMSFTRGFIVIAFVFIVPILKPIESQDIQFNHPLWTASLNSVSNITSPESKNSKGGNEITNPKHPTYHIDLNNNESLKIKIEQLETTIKNLVEEYPNVSLNVINNRLNNIQKDIESLETADLSTLNSRLNKIDSALQNIKNQLKDIDTELNKSKKR